VEPNVIPNTWVAVLRGEGVDDLGDPTPPTDPVEGLERIPFYLREKSRQMPDEAGGLRTVRYGVARGLAGTDIRAGDYLRDHRTGRLWHVQQVEDGETRHSGAPSLSFEVRAV
jgi:hypothetical protein